MLISTILNSMTRYEEICHKIDKTRDVYSQSRRKLENEFTKALAAYLSCQPTMITLEFDEPTIHEATITCDFRVMIRFKNLSVDDTITLENFSYEYGQNGETAYYVILYHGQPYSLETMQDTLFDEIFHNIQEFYL